MGTMPNVAWIGVDGLRKLDRIITRAPHHQQETAWAALDPLLNDNPTRADWPRRLETALRAAAPGVAGALIDQLRSLVRDRCWQELTGAVARDWPGHPDPLDGPAVLRRLEQLAAQVAPRSPSLRRQVMDDAPGVILLAFGNYQRSRPFNPWARRVLRNHAVSLYRRQRRARTDSAYLDTVAAPLASLAEDDLAEVLSDFRRLCDRVRFPPQTTKGPALAAVFALETRLRLLAGLPRFGPDLLDSHLPLREGERGLRVQRDWPTLGELWEHVSTSAPGPRPIDAIRRACRQLAPRVSVEGLHKVWNTWLHRAKTAVARQLEPHSQAHLFFYLFPTHRPVGAGGASADTTGVPDGPGRQAS